MTKIHFERGKRFECSVEVFQFIYSNWQAADHITGGHWKVERHQHKFKGRKLAFWGEFDLAHHEFDGKNGVFTYFVTVGGKGIDGSGKLTIRYGVVDRNLVYGEGNVDIEFKGFLPRIFERFFHSRLQKLTDELVNYQHSACIALAENLKETMAILSEDEQDELSKLMEGKRIEDIFESDLSIFPVDDKWLLRFETPIPTHKKISHKVGIKETYTGLLNGFNSLIETGYHFYNLSRSQEPDRNLVMAGRDFYEEAKVIGNEFYRKCISDEMAIWLTSMFNYKKEPNIRVRIEAEGECSLLPWELLHDGDDFLCLKSGVVRIEASIAKPVLKSLDITGVLVVASNPQGDLENVEQEGEAILNTIKSLPGVKAKFLRPDDASVENLINEVELGQYQVIHYSGHSNFEEKSPGSSYLLMKHGRHLMADDLARLSKKCDLQMVFLNSCLSAATKIDLFRTTGLSSAFVRTGVPYVIGMRWSVSDEGATLLSQKFYQEFISTKDPVEALRKSRVYVGQRKDWKDPAWAAPIIHIA